MALSVVGKVKRMYVSSKNVLNVSLEGASEHPKGYFYIYNDAGNYNSVYSLILAAAINRYDIAIRATKEFTSATDNIDIEYVTVDW